MKLICLFFLFSLFQAFGQDTLLIKPKGKWVFYGRERPDSIPLGDSFTGFVFHKSADSTLESKGAYLNDRKEGLWTYFYQDGQTVRAKITYQNGQYLGPKSRYFKNGKLQDTGYVWHEDFIGRHASYYENGGLKFEGYIDSSHKEKGIFLFYHPASSYYQRIDGPLSLVYLSDEKYNETFITNTTLFNHTLEVMFTSPYNLLNNSLMVPEVPLLINGLDNELVLAGISSADSSFQLIHGKDTLAYQEKYWIRPNASWRDTMYFRLKNEIILEKHFFTANAGIPQLFLGNIRDTLVSLDSLIKNDNSFYFSYEPLLLKADIRILNYEGFILKETGEIIPFTRGSKRKDLKCPPNQFSFTQKKLLHSMKSGDVLLINEVQAIGPDSPIRKLKTNLRFKIKS